MESAKNPQLEISNIYRIGKDYAIHSYSTKVKDEEHYNKWPACREIKILGFYAPEFGFRVFGFFNSIKVLLILEPFKHFWVPKYPKSHLFIWSVDNLIHVSTEIRFWLGGELNLNEAVSQVCALWRNLTGISN